MYRLIVCLVSLMSTAVFAADDTYITNIGANVTARANEYAAEIRQITRQTYNHDLTKNSSEEPIATHLHKYGQVLVFLSFSMPEQSLSAWLTQCKRSGATPVIRGLINHSFKETLMAVQSLGQKTGIGVQLDPVLFQTFSITQVPAVVYVKDTPECPANMNCLPASFDRMYGDVTLDYALEHMNDEQSSEFNLIVQRLRGES